MKKFVVLAAVLAFMASPAVAKDHAEPVFDQFGAIGYKGDGLLDPTINTVVVTQKMRDEVAAKGYDCYPTPCKWLSISELQAKYNK